MKSWKIDAIAGLIAGIIAGIIGLISALIQFSIGIQYFFLEPPPETPITGIAIREITINAFYGIGLGIIYSRIQDLIPGRSLKKGIYYGLVLWIIFNLRTATIASMYRFYDWAIIFLLMWTLIIYGPVLGILYEKLGSKYIVVQKRAKKKGFDLVKGFQIGAIAGIVYGTIVFLTNTVSAYIGIYGQIPGTMESPYLTDIGFMMSQLGAHIVFNLIWGAVFGVFFVIFYDRVPGKGVLKGLYFALIILFITSLRVAIYDFAYGFFILAENWSIAGLIPAIGYGLTIGYLYKKPTK